MWPGTVLSGVFIGMAGSPPQTVAPTRETATSVKPEPPGGWCITCGVVPRPKRTNWHRIPDYADPDPYHHRCHRCYEAWIANKRREERAAARAYMRMMLCDTPSRHRIGKSRKSHICELAGCPIVKGESYWRFVVYGPQNVKICVNCAKELGATDGTADDA